MKCDVAIIGGGFGGIAAALALVERGLKVAMTEEYPWIGGQVTSQGLCALDQFHDPVGDTVGINRRYGIFRDRTRDYYIQHYRLSDFGKSQLKLSAGNARVSPLTAEPHVAYQVILDMLKEPLSDGRLTLMANHIPVAARREGRRVVSFTCADRTVPQRAVSVEADFFLDATENGDTYPLLQVGYRLGAEARSEFDEPHAPERADRGAIQSFTYCFVVEFVPGGNFTIPKPAGYEEMRDRQPFYLGVPYSTLEEPGGFFKINTRSNGHPLTPFWFYRCLFDNRNFDDPAQPFSRAVINVDCNDYHHEAYLENPDREAVLERARQLSRAYLYWLQTEAPRDDGGFGYPELRSVPEATGTPDGMAMAPYVREGRRLKACQTIVEQDISEATQPLARARNFPNSVGIGSFLIDIHRRVGSRGLAQMTRPYQVPLGALVSPELENFAVANKGIGVTQITNGAYRLHNVEWAIGEAAGELAAYCLEYRVANPNLEGRDLFVYQRRLIQAGVPVYWYEDLAHDHPGFEAAQFLAVTGVWPGHPQHLRFEPEHSLARHRFMFESVMNHMTSAGMNGYDFKQANLVAHGTRKYDLLHRIMAYLDRTGWPDFAISRRACPDELHFEPVAANEVKW